MQFALKINEFSFAVNGKFIEELHCVDDEMVNKRDNSLLIDGRNLEIEYEEIIKNDNIIYI